MSRNSGRKAAFACALVVSGPAAFAQGVLDPVVDGDSLRAEIAIGTVSATLTVRFENVVGLSAENLGLSARLVDPLSLDLTSRLASGVSLPAAFPLLVRIEPPSNGGLAFSGVVSVELYTHDLQYTAGSPLRLLSAPLGGRFTDVTTALSGGSVRSGGTKPDFSEFAIGVDLRPLGAVIDSKYGQLRGLLDQHAAAIGSSLLAELQGLAGASEQAYRSGAPASAIAYIEAFCDRVKAASGSALPDVWRSSRDVVNVAGALRAAAGTLRFSLTQASNAT